LDIADAEKEFQLDRLEQVQEDIGPNHNWYGGFWYGGLWGFGGFGNEWLPKQLSKDSPSELFDGGNSGKFAPARLVAKD